MTKEEMKIETALILGWERTDKWVSGWMLRSPEWPNGMPGVLPDFPGDLNAAAEFEKTLNADQCREYQDTLIKIVVTVDKLFPSRRAYPMDGFLIHATAEQRDQAFLRVHGKWRDQ